jgi:hypothetical protein
MRFRVNGYSSTTVESSPRTQRDTVMHITAKSRVYSEGLPLIAQGLHLLSECLDHWQDWRLINTQAAFIRNPQFFPQNVDTHKLRGPA